ncbi:hypothetical protein B0H16DRAFT_1731466 [Mycena metata]|uniref:Uncharacterized protein n=1 Tax=Mycena metata TaxID=1033252 RepID=A0AAD7I6U9_9AGAR|nr:hypothetical protein B0H16DRAFT_1731466 [Mycena metata]
MEAFHFPENLPPLPLNAQLWSANVIAGHQVLDNAYTRALAALHEEDSDTLRYKLLSSNIVDNLIPILEGLENDMPRDWIDDCARLLGPLVYKLEVAALAAEGVERDNIVLLEPVTREGTGKRGCPAKHIDPEYLKEAAAPNRNIKLGTLASALKVHRHTLQKRMRELGLSKRFDDIDDAELDLTTSPRNLPLDFDTCADISGDMGCVPFEPIW